MRSPFQWIPRGREEDQAGAFREEKHSGEGREIRETGSALAGEGRKMENRASDRASGL
jgi:hypothetical protein